MVKEPTRSTQPQHEYDPGPAPKADTAKADAAAAEKQITEQQKANAERRDAAFEHEQEQREQAHEADKTRLAAIEKFQAAQRKEAARRAALSAEERAAEDAKRAAMTDEQRRKDDESKGLVLEPALRDGEISLLAGTPQHPVLAEKAHTAEFVLSEANGQRSRGNAYLNDPVTVRVGQPLKKTAEATATLPATYVLAAAGAECHALALYGGTSQPAPNGLRIAALVRDAEVNGLLIDWGSITAPEQAIGVATLATNGIIVRI
jgi:hypothetical protein